MSDGEPKKEPTTETTEETTTKEEATGMVDKALAAAERLEKANAEQKALLEKQQQILTLQTLGGRTTAGQAPEEEKEETPLEYAKRILGVNLTDEERKRANRYS